MSQRMPCNSAQEGRANLAGRLRVLSLGALSVMMLWANETRAGSFYMHGASCQAYRHSSNERSGDARAYAGPAGFTDFLGGQSVACPLFFRAGAAKTFYVDYSATGALGVECYLSQVDWSSKLVWQQSQASSKAGAGFFKFSPPAGFNGYGTLQCIFGRPVTAGGRTQYNTLRGYNGNWSL
jgi:hypothetical protein